MILPTKGVSNNRALLSIGEDIIIDLGQPKSVTEAWTDLEEKWRQRRVRERLTFDWFTLALALLYAIGLIESTTDGRIRRSDATASPVRK